MLRYTVLHLSRNDEFLNKPTYKGVIYFCEILL